MKRYIRSEKYKRDNISVREYDNAVNVGKAVLSELHSRYPDIFPIGKTRSIKRRHAWSDHLYVYVDTGITHDDIITNGYRDIYDFERKFDKIISDQVLPALNISNTDFAVGLSVVDDEYRVPIVVYDLNSNTEISK